jgi:hypothetical protein
VQHFVPLTACRELSRLKPFRRAERIRQLELEAAKRAEEQKRRAAFRKAVEDAEGERLTRERCGDRCTKRLGVLV